MQPGRKNSRLVIALVVLCAAVAMLVVVSLQVSGKARRRAYWMAGGFLDKVGAVELAQRAQQHATCAGNGWTLLSYTLKTPAGMNSFRVEIARFYEASRHKFPDLRVSSSDTPDPCKVDVMVSEAAAPGLRAWLLGKGHKPD